MKTKQKLYQNIGSHLHVSETESEAKLHRAVLAGGRPEVLRRRAFLRAERVVRLVEQVEDLRDAVFARIADDAARNDPDLGDGALVAHRRGLAADAALECVLYADQRQQAFTYSTHSRTNQPNATVCNSVVATITSYTYTGTQLTLIERISLDGGIHCADMTIYKKAAPDASGYTTYLFAQGYNTSCATVADPQNARVASRGIDARY